MSPPAKFFSGPKPIDRNAVSTKFILCWCIGACGGQWWLFCGDGLAADPVTAFRLNESGLMEIMWLDCPCLYRNTICLER
jgi:hypothetical protein